MDQAGLPMKLPVWVTVFVSGIVGGWIGGEVSQALLLPLMFHTSPKSLAAHWMLVILMGGLCQAAITGGALLLLHATVQSHLAAGGGIGLLPAFGLFSLLLEIVGIVVTATLISNADEGSGGGSRLDLYGGQSYLDEYRKGEEG